MTKERAEEILRIVNECEREIRASIRRTKEECDEESHTKYKEHAARLMARMFNSIVAPIYERHPELSPEWYRSDRDTRAHGMPRELQRELLALFDSVLERVERLPEGGPDVPDDSGIRPFQERINDVLSSIHAVKSFLGHAPT